MVKFAHIADCHLGCWRQEELQKLNFKSFETIIDQVISERPDFILIAGDLFDSAYPPIEILKDSFAVFKKINDAKIPVYLIAGSHDFSASGKTFLDVLEKAGFCKNVENTILEEDGRIKLTPYLHENIAIYGYPGRKSGMEIQDLKKVYFDGVHQTNIFMIHTTIKDVVGTIPMESVEKENLPVADYYAMGHIHKRFEADHSTSKFVYPGPTFPCNFQELVDLKHGSYNMVEMTGGKIKTENREVPLKEIAFIHVKIENALTATQEIISAIDKHNLQGKIALLKLSGTLTVGKTGDIHFQEIEDFIHKKGALATLRNISSLKISGQDINSSSDGSESMENIEKKILGEFSSANPADFNKYLPTLMNILSTEKNEDEKSATFEERIVSELKNTLEIQEMI